eukprot:GILI01014617.1.p1 GENE.GILI01014617.1~~GILI01014617.1.p1  ORF type:complete len:473 (+),score=78.12 GILI01014617.1:91-1509(+)
MTKVDERVSEVSLFHKAALIISKFASATNLKFVMIFYPYLSDSLGIPREQFSYVFAAGEFAGLFIFATGPLIAKIGSHNGLLLSNFIVILSLLLPLMYASVITLALSRVCICFGYGFMSSAYQCLFGERILPAHVGKVTATIEMSWAFSTLIGLPLAGFLLENVGWASPFVVLFIISSIDLVFVYQWAVPPSSSFTLSSLFSKKSTNHSTSSASARYQELEALKADGEVEEDANEVVDMDIEARRRAKSANDEQLEHEEAPAQNSHTTSSSSSSHSQGSILSLIRSFRSEPAPLMYLIAGFLLLTGDLFFYTILSSFFKDKFGLSAESVGSTQFLFGCGEFLAANIATFFCDSWGLKRSVIAGMLCSSFVYFSLGFAQNVLWLSAALISVKFVASEFTIIAMLGLSTDVCPNSRSIFISLFFSCTSVGRLFGSTFSQALYGATGLLGVSVLSSACLLSSCFFVYKCRIETKE